MDNTVLYAHMQKWQESNQVYFGDKVRFILHNDLHEGFLTGFDIESMPLKPIIRYVTKNGNSRITALRPDAVIRKMN